MSQSQVLALVGEHAELDEGPRRKALKYLEAFYDEIASPQQRERRIVGNCR